MQTLAARLKVAVRGFHRIVRQRTLTRIGMVGSVILLSMVIQLVTDVLLARRVAPEVFGKLSFVIQAMNLVTTLSLLGVDQSLPRQVSKSRLSKLDWVPLFIQVLSIAATISLLASTGIGLFYNLGWSLTVVLSLGAVSFAVMQMAASLIRSNLAFASAQLLRNSWRFFLLPLAVLLGAMSRWPDTYVYIALLVASLSGAVASLLLLGRAGRGQVPIDRREAYSDGTVFWLMMLTLLLTNTMDRFFAARLLTYVDVANYSAAWNILNAPYSLVSASFGYVALPLVVRGNFGTLLRWRVLGPLCGIVLVVGVGAIIAGPWLLHLVYGSKYAVATSVIVWLVIGGSVKMLYVIPGAGVGGRASRRRLWVLVALEVVALLVAALAYVVLVPLYGLPGVAAAAALGWVLRALAGYALLWATEKHAGVDLAAVPSEQMP